MSELTVSQQTPSSPPGGTETQISKCDRPVFFFFFCNGIFTFSWLFVLSAGPSPPPSTISDHPSSPPPSVEPAVDQEVISSPPYPKPQPHSGNMAIFMKVITLTAHG